jgi:hypothetical protein
VLPNLIIIGAAKAGTTSLNWYLDEHPEVHMSPEKEPSFFTGPPAPPGTRSHGPWFRIGDRAAYEALFDTQAPVRGEASPSYTMFPIVEGAAERVHAMIPDAKLIYLVRDSIDRTFAHYRQRVAAEGERRPPAEAIGDLGDPRNPYVCPSRYATQLREYRNLFPPTQILVLDQAELQADRQATLRRVFLFLGVDPSFKSGAFQQELNVGAEKRAYSRRYARLHEALKRPVLERLPTGLRRAFATATRPALTRRLPDVASNEALDKDVRAELREIFAPEVAELRSMTGLRLASWSL